MELINHVLEDEGEIINIKATKDGHRFELSYVVRSTNLCSRYHPIINSASYGGVTRVTYDGYWFLKRLDLGKHEFYFAGYCSASSRNVKEKYHAINI